MRKWLFIIVFFAVVIAALPYGFGIQAEKRLTHFAKEATQAADDITFSITDYQRGWLHSQARLKVNITPPKEMATYLGEEGMAFTVLQDIYHGPLFAAKKPGSEKSHLGFGTALVHYRIPLSEERKQTIEKWFADQATKPQVWVSMLIHFDGSTSIEGEVLPFDYVSNELSATLKWLGGKARWNVSPKLDRMDADLSLKGITVLLPEATLSVGEVSLRGDQAKSYHGLMIGQGELHLSALRMTADGKERFRLEGLSLKSKSDTDEKHYSFDVLLKVGQIVIDGQTYGPGHWQATLSNLNAPALAALLKKVQALSGSTMDAQRQLMGLTLLPDVVKVLASGVNYEQALQLTLPDGQLKFQSKVSLPSQAAKQTENLLGFGLLKHLVVEANLVVPKTFAEMVLTQYYQRQINAYPEIAQALKNKHASPKPAEGDQLLEQAALEQPAGVLTDSLSMTMDTTTIDSSDNLVEKEVKSLIDNALKQQWLQEKGKDFSLMLEFKQGRLKVNGQVITAFAGNHKQ